MDITRKIYPIGLDISDMSIKAIELTKQHGQIGIKSFGKADLKPGVIKDGEILIPDQVVAAIKQIIATPLYGKFSSKATITSLPEPKTFLKLLKLSSSSDMSEIGTEIEKHVPFEIKDICFDWQIVRQNSQFKEVLISAAPRQVVWNYITVLRKAGLEVTALEVEALPICRSLLMEEGPEFKGEKSASYMIVDIGATGTSIVFYSEGTIVFSMSMDTSGEAITEKIMNTLELERDQAEKAKIICGLDENKAQGVVMKILSDIITGLINHLRQAADFYRNNFPERSPLGLVILCGGGANIKSLDAVIKNELNIPVKIGEVFVNFTAISTETLKSFIETHSLKLNNTRNADRNLTASQDSSIAYSTAIGLAMRGVFNEE